MKIPFLGPLRSLPAPATDCPIHVVTARVAAARKDDATVRFVSGWGSTREEASLSCEREGIERYCAQFHGVEKVERARADALVGTAALPPEILLIDERQFLERRAWNAAHPGFSKLSARWNSQQPIDWVTASPALSSAERWLPAGLCYLGHDRDRSAGLPPADSNGLAVGRSLEDAAVRAFVELAERDAVAIWWYNRLARPLFDPDSLDDLLVSAYAAWSKVRRRSFHLHDLTHDMGPLVLAAVTHDFDGGHIAVGFGAGWSSAQAARHAVGELAQFEANLFAIEMRVALRGEKGLSPEAKSLVNWWRTATLLAHSHLAHSAAKAAPQTVTPLDLQGCLALCRAQGMDFLALDLSRDKISEPVVRVVVPGMRPMWARFAPGRLFDVPVKLGWRKVPIDAASLNPAPLMF